jgi:hypothetical protein
VIIGEKISLPEYEKKSPVLMRVNVLERALSKTRGLLRVSLDRAAVVTGPLSPESDRGRGREVGLLERLTTAQLNRRDNLAPVLFVCSRSIALQMVGKKGRCGRGRRPACTAPLLIGWDSGDSYLDPAAALTPTIICSTNAFRAFRLTQGPSPLCYPPRAPTLSTIVRTAQPDPSQPGRLMRDGSAANAPLFLRVCPVPTTALRYDPEAPLRTHIVDPSRQ